jgi:hypothetical protein
MVTNSLGKRKSLAANRKAQACTQGAFAISPFKFWGGVWGVGRGGERIFFHIFPWFPLCSL